MPKWEVTATTTYGTTYALVDSTSPDVSDPINVEKDHSFLEHFSSQDQEKLGQAWLKNNSGNIQPGNANEAFNKFKDSVKNGTILATITNSELDSAAISSSGSSGFSENIGTDTTVVKEKPRENTQKESKNTPQSTPKILRPSDFSDQFDSSNHRNAAAGEYNAHQLMLDNGFIPIGNTNGEYRAGISGIDGVYENLHPKPDYAIVEAKYNTAKLGETNDGKQMSDRWITADSSKRLKDAGLDESEVRKIEKGLRRNKGDVEKYLIRNKKDGSLRLSKLDSNGNIIKSSKVNGDKK
ncbi:hypothetical protein [Gallaecimonas pentaromativorans]|uniref:Uncharacterized protein n=1 Tax=Gallaecimonas pentaromativorans TaxID=584787 RepID=A0A3N1PPL2_9GAMM|nr:hypothetical protein [Gallaecimonas pentaromativorans]ROQ28847.1 hypothetical protein EDC28_103444 [Gallaecimonas pentaromativorans]